MAARRVSLGYLVSSMVLAVGVAAATFQLKYAVRDREHELAATQGQDRAGALGDPGARADLAYLTRPDRIALQAAPARHGAGARRPTGQGRPASRLGAAAVGERSDAGTPAVGLRIELRGKPISVLWAISAVGARLMASFPSGSARPAA